MGLMKKLTSAVVASSLVLGLFGTVLAAPTAEEANAAYERLNYYGIAEGILREDGTKDPALDETLTRVQMVALLVKAFGLKESAQYMAGAQTFSDVPANHWASGYLAIAKNIAEKNGNVIGYPDGTFGPENQVTAIEVLGFALKFLGIPVSGGANWKDNMIAAAKDAGVLTDADVEKYLSNPDEVATRGLAFAMADAIFYNYKGADGKSVYTRIDTEAPSVTLGEVPATTNKASIEITGTVSGDYIEVYVGSDKVTVNPDGTFAHAVALKVGSNSIEVTAKDRAGNVGSAKAVVERVPGEAAKIQITAPEGGVAAGSTIDLPVAIVDAEGANTGITDFKVDAGEAGTWADGKLTAGTKAGKYTITATYEGLEPASIEIEIVAGPLAKVEPETKSVKPGTAVKLIGVDQYGNKVEGVSFAEAEEYAEAFIEGDQFVATKPGTYKVVGTKGEGEEAVTAEGTVSVFGEHASFDISVEGDLIANNTKQKVTVTAVDKDGNAVTDFDGEVTLETNFAESASKEAENGVAVFEVTVDEGMAGLEAEFTAKYKKSDDETIEATESFEVKAQVGTQLELKGDTYLAINQPAWSGSVRILDQTGEELISGDDYEVKLTISGPAYFADTTDKEMTVELSGGSVDFQLDPIDPYTEGDVTITATAEGLTSATLNVKAVYALTAKDLVVKPLSDGAKKAANKEAFEFEIKLVDKNGVPVFVDYADGIDLVLDFDTDKPGELTVQAWTDGETAGEDGDVTESTPDEDGKVPLKLEDEARFLKVAVKANNLTGDVKFTVSEDEEDLTLGKATGTVSFKAADAAKVAFNKENLNVLSNTENTLTVSLQDEAGNPVAKSGVEVTIEATGDNANYVKIGNKEAGKPYKAKTNDEGKITVPVTVLPYVDNYESVTLTAKADGLQGTDSIPITVVPSVARSLSVTTYTYDDTKGWSPASSFDAGQVVFVRVVVTDNNGITVKDDSFAGRLSISGLKLTEIGNGEDNSTSSWEEKLSFVWGATGTPSIPVEDTDGGFDDVEFAPVEAYVTAFTARKAGSYTLTVSDDTAAQKVERSRTISVKAGKAAGLDYTGDTLSLKEGQPTKVVLNVVDDYGNKVSTSAVKGEIVGQKFYVSYDSGKVRKTAQGLDNGFLEIEIKQSVASYTIWVVAEADDPDAQLTISDVAPAGDDSSDTNEDAEPANGDDGSADEGEEPTPGESGDSGEGQ